jgi:hypothetical protein
MKLITMGAAMAINVDVTLGRKPDWALSALLTALSEFPNRPDITRLPADSKGEFGLATLLTIWDPVTSPNVPGTRSRILRREFGSSDFAAKPPRTAAMEDSMPRETDRSDSLRALAMPPRLGLSSIPSNVENIEPDISNLLPYRVSVTDSDS